MTSGPSRPLRRAIVGAVLPLAFVLLTLLPLFLFRDRLPEPLATHWGVDGRPNGFMSFTLLAAFNLVFAGVPAAIMAFSAWRQPAYRGEVAPVAAVTCFVAAIVASASWLTVDANLDAGTWTQADPIGVVDLVAPFLVAGIIGTIAALLARSIELEPPPRSAPPSAGLTPGTRAFWVGTARARWALALFVGFLVLGVVAALGRHPAFALIALGGVPGLMFTSIRVAADRHGVRIAYGAFGWPRRTIPLADIRGADVVHVVPLARGGWGYRGSLKLFRRASIVLRGGDGIELALAGDRVLTITVDRAEEGAGVINDLVAAPSAS